MLAATWHGCRRQCATNSWWSDEIISWSFKPDVNKWAWQRLLIVYNFKNLCSFFFIRYWHVRIIVASVGLRLWCCNVIADIFFAGKTIFLRLGDYFFYLHMDSRFLGVVSSPSEVIFEFSNIKSHRSSQHFDKLR